MTTDTLDLAELERLEKAATLGPWQVVETKFAYNTTAEFEGIAREIRTTWVHPQSKTFDMVVVPCRRSTDVERLRYGVHIEEKDAALIAALRNAAPALFKHICALTARVEKSEAEAREARLWDHRSQAANKEAARELGDWLLVPPDGGDLTLAEGVARIKEAFAVAQAELAEWHKQMGRERPTRVTDDALFEANHAIAKERDQAWRALTTARSQLDKAREALHQIELVAANLNAIEIARAALSAISPKAEETGG